MNPVESQSEIAAAIKEAVTPRKPNRQHLESFDAGVSTQLETVLHTSFEPSSHDILTAV